MPLADSAERDLQPEVYFQLPSTPVQERRFRKLSHGPGEIHVHHGLKDQRLPGEEFRYGLRGVTGCTTEEAMKAGMMLGVAEYKNGVAERVYESTKKEPLGKPHIRGHILHMLPEGFGNPSAAPTDCKQVIYPVAVARDSEEAQAMYRKTHNNYAPGERIQRNYKWPAETQAKDFSFGAGLVAAVEGAGAKMALNMNVEDDGTWKRTRFATKVFEDYRHVEHPKLFHKVHPKQGAEGPPMHADHRYGIKSAVSEYTAGSCIKGYYSLEEQLPDQDLGRCIKPGRRNVTTETRAFGVPSVRTDIGAPHPQKRSIGDERSYGDEPGAASILCPQRFDPKGIPDREFLVRRSREELQALMTNAPFEHLDFEGLWDESARLFDDGLPLVSLDAMLFAHSRRIEQRVGKKLQGFHLVIPVS